MMTLTECLVRTARERGDQTAILFGERSWTYREFLDLALRAAAGFRAAGIKSGDRVMLLSKNSPEFVATVFALGHIGAAAIPVNFYQKAEEIAFIGTDSGACGVVTQKGFLGPVREACKHCPGVRKIWVTDSSEAPAGTEAFAELLKSPPASADEKPGEDSTALILYTSGTTGKAKGVMLTQANLVSNADAAARHLGLTARDRFLCILPMFHVFAWTANTLLPLMLGCRLTIVENIRPPKQWLELMKRDRITIFAAVPQIFALMAEQAKGLKRWAMRWLYLRTVRFAVSGAAPLLPETQEKFQKGLGTPLLQGYGLTETSPIISANTLKENRLGSVGRPIPGVQVRIVDEEEQPVPDGTEGEICVRGSCVMKGYYGLPDETRAAFTRDGWLKTGDVGVIDPEGFLSIRDRIKDMIIVKGLKVFSIQIEELLLTHPAVAEAAVIGIPDATGDETIKGFVVLKEGAAADKAGLMKLCQEKLPPYKRPRDIEIRKELPKNALQKVLKRELRKQG